MGKSRESVLTIAGFDPSGGAGILADIKTFEQLKVSGEAIITANTIQNENKFDSVNWVEEELVLKQLDFLLESKKVEFVKIGLIKNEKQLKAISDRLLSANKKTKIIWDPILSASTGFDFHQQKLNIDLKNIFLITPNLEEIKAFGAGTSVEIAKILASETNVFLKGGHSDTAIGKDFLYNTKRSVFGFNPKRTDVTEKHGSGCVLSSAITANLAKGYALNKACLRGKDYVTRFLASNKSKIGNHKT